MKRILGIDPGSAKTGYAVLEDNPDTPRLIASGVISPSGRTLAARLGEIFEGLCSVIDQHRPVEASIESVFMHRNAASSLKLGQARGAAVCASTVHGVAVYEYGTRTVKKTIVGKGNASKGQVQFMVARLLGDRTSYGEDESDAMALALCHVVMRGARTGWRQIAS